MYLGQNLVRIFIKFSQNLVRILPFFPFLKVRILKIPFGSTGYVINCRLHWETDWLMSIIWDYGFKKNYFLYIHESYKDLKTISIWSNQGPTWFVSLLVVRLHFIVLVLLWVIGCLLGSLALWPEHVWASDWFWPLPFFLTGRIVLLVAWFTFFLDSLMTNIWF